MDSNCKIIVRNKDISPGKDISINYEDEYAKLPLVAIVKALGGEVDWVDDKKVILLFDDVEYVLNPTKKTLKQQGKSFNMIALPPGVQHGAYYQICDKEFIVDSDCLRYFLRLLGAKITINYDAATVIID